MHTPSLLCAAGGTHAALWAVWVRSAGVELASGEHPRGALRAADGRQQPWLWQGSRRQAALGRWLAWIADEVLNQAQKYGPEWAEKYAKLALAMIMQESGGNQSAYSSAGAIGLMQLMPDTASSLGVNPWDWKQNITGGLKYIDQLRNMFGWDTSKIIAGYNAGPQAVKNYGGVPPYRETQNHVGIVSDFYNQIDNFAGLKKWLYLCSRKLT